MNTIAEKWKEFEDRVMPENCPPVQRQEMRRAFYAGAATMLNLHLLAVDDNLSEDASVAMMEWWHDECERFAQQVLDGNA